MSSDLTSMQAVLAQAIQTLLQTQNKLDPNSDSILEQTDLPVPENWKHTTLKVPTFISAAISGNTVDVTYEVFDRTLSHTKSMGQKVSDTKSARESNQLVRIIFYRPMESYQDETFSEWIPRPDQPVIMVLCFGEKHGTHNVYSNDWFQGFKKYFGKIEFLDRYRHPTSLFALDEFLKKKPEALSEKFITPHSIVLNIEHIPQQLQEQCIQSLVEPGLLSERDGHFFRSIAKRRTMPQPEIEYRAGIQRALDAKNYNEAIALAAKVHQIHVEIALKRNKHSSVKHTSGNGLISICDDSDCALELARGLQSISPDLALKALKIITRYSMPHTQPRKDIEIVSPFLSTAMELFADINLMASAKNKEIDRKSLKDVVFSGLMSAAMIGDEQRKSATIRQVIASLNSLCGYNPLETDKKLFKNTTLDLSNPQDFFDQLIFPMADALYDLRQQQKPDLIYSSRKSSQKAKENKLDTEALATGQATDASLAKTAASSGKTLTPSFSTSVSTAHSGKVSQSDAFNAARSLDEDDDILPIPEKLELCNVDKLKDHLNGLFGKTLAEKVKLHGSSLWVLDDKNASNLSNRTLHLQHLIVPNLVTKNAYEKALKSLAGHIKFNEVSPGSAKFRISVERIDELAKKLKLNSSAIKIRT